METELISADCNETIADAVERSVALLSAGEVVALPTETVYGLAANAFDEGAVAKVFEAKSRPSFDPLIVHLPNKRMLPQIAEVPDEVADTIGKLINVFWPGPLTLVLPKTEEVPDIVTAGLPTVAVRQSADPVFKKVVAALGKPLAAPSANRFGRISPTSASAVMSELRGLIPLVVDGGATSCGVESTIVRVLPGSKKPLIQILRAGPVTPDDLKKYGKVEVVSKGGEGSPEVPGQLPSHYAPATPLRLLEQPEFSAEEGKRYGLLSYRGQEKDGYLGLANFEMVQVLSPGSGKLPEAAVRLFYALRQLDEAGLDEIIAEPFPERGLGLAIMERLRRAAAK